ncbi:hypothetical protein [Actinacidiphila rubida]|uniref:Uncharacterized protein n=1 Tax=Actinacidiphila rubida TaxID=310780 RepID=A0A1H8DLX3_9ACTN|nr:hypothetical protein [Actinacidiphila rubida]SEN07538.1 hypothetical protein SAMN05216267_1001151 [Actinacidiphila rubida]
MDWYPEPDESTLVRTPIRFATGYAPPVAGSRWFRDTSRRDIQGELPGWPAGPEYRLHAPATQAANRVGGGLLGGLATALKAGMDAVTGNATTVSGASKASGKAQYPADEVEDFPVLWAAPGTRARSLPWQLDPGRRPDRYRVDAAVTERRLVLLGVGSDMTAAADVLWETPRDAIAGAEHLAFSEGGNDLRIRFTDDSWTRLASGDSQKLVGLLSDHRKLLPESALTPAQRERVARFVAELPAAAQAPRFYRLASGAVLVEAQAPAKVGRGLSETHSIFMGETGEPARPQPGDL